MNTPRCKKCGKRLTDPLSIAAGLGPECRGGVGQTHASTHVHNRRSTGHGYPVAPEVRSASDLPAIFYAGRDSQTHTPIQFVRQDDGRYLSSSGTNIDAPHLYSWINRFGVYISIVAPPPASEAYPAEVR